MRIRTLLTFFIVFFVIAVRVSGIFPLQTVLAEHQPLAQHVMPLTDRYGNAYVNNVFKDNILLTLAYMTGRVRKTPDIDWQELEKPSQYEVILRPGEVFAFHDDVIQSYNNMHVVTTNAHFGGNEGFLSDGYLFGDGVCHLASLINWTAKDAGLTVVAPTRHDFASIPDIPKEYGTSIYASYGQHASNQQQNLYIQNTYDTPVVFAFDYRNGALGLSISKTN
jgi:hypothetical protein